MGAKIVTSDAVYIWINKRTGKVYISASATSNKVNWIEHEKAVYERQMINGNKNVPVLLYNDLLAGHEFQSIVMVFDNVQDGFDFGNQLIKVTKKVGYTYSIRAKVNKIKNKGEPKETKIFNAINDILKIIQETTITAGDQIAELIENSIYNCISEDGVHIEKIEAITLDNNSYTNQEANKKSKDEETKSIYCPYCHMAIPLSGLCANFMCDHLGEKVL